MAVIYDAVNVSVLPPGADAYIGYVDGSIPELRGGVHIAAVRARFPGVRIISVSTVGAVPADFIDCERYDANPTQAVAGVRAGNYRGIYCSTEGDHGIDVVRSLNPPPFDWFAAHYTGVQHIEPGSVATQWTNNGGGGQYDISLALDSWFNPGPSPAPPPPPQVKGLAPMICQDPVTGGNWCVDPRDGHVEADLGAPYLGGLNSPPNRFGWQQVGQIVGIAPTGTGGNEGYSIAVLANEGPLFFHLYTFPRNGSLA